MPIHNVGYRPWTGKKTAQWTRWWHIAESGVFLAIKSNWVKRIVFFAWLPVMYWGVAFFAFERGVMESDGVASPLTEIVDELPVNQSAKVTVNKNLKREILAKRIRDSVPLPSMDKLADAISTGDEETMRNRVWNFLLLTFFRYPQATVILFLLAFIAPGLISRDFRSRAFLLYFSKPIGRMEYMLGKLFVPALFIVFVSTLPALTLYLFGIGMSPDLSVVYSTWDIPVRIILASFCLVVPTALLALMLSSLTHESRFASFAWFAVWALGHGAWFSIVVSQAIRMQAAPNTSEVMNSPIVQQWSRLSLYNNLGEVQSWIFGFNSFNEVWPAVLVLSMLSLISVVVLYRRISAPVNV